jgi:hypothetical protein
MNITRSALLLILFVCLFGFFSLNHKIIDMMFPALVRKCIAFFFSSLITS